MNMNWHIAGWVIGVLLLYFGLRSLLHGNVFIAIVELVIGGLFIPPVRQWAMRYIGKG